VYFCTSEQVLNEIKVTLGPAPIIIHMLSVHNILPEVIMDVLYVHSVSLDQKYFGMPTEMDNSANATFKVLVQLKTIGRFVNL
jgi:hypothetical protein